jgi:hypothetical protein
LPFWLSGMLPLKLARILAGSLALELPRLPALQSKNVVLSMGRIFALIKNLNAVDVAVINPAGQILFVPGVLAFSVRTV